MTSFGFWRERPLAVIATLSPLSAAGTNRTKMRSMLTQQTQNPTPTRNNEHDHEVVRFPSVLGVVALFGCGYLFIHAEMATAAHRAAVQTALLSVRGLRRRRLGHVSPTDYPQNGLDKWGRKKLDYNHGNGSSGSHHQYNNYYNNNGKISQSLTNNSLPPLLNGVGRRPVVPRATLVLGGEKSIANKCRRNGLNSSSGGGSENGVATTTSSSTATNYLGEGDIGDTDGGGSNRMDLPHHVMEQHEHEQQSKQRQRSNPGSQRFPSLIMPSSSSLQSILDFSTNNTADDASTTAATSNPLNNINGTIQHAGSDHSNTSITSNSTSSSSSITSDSNSRRKKKYSSDLIVILDMDECLIHSQFLSDRCVDKYRQVEDRPTNKSMHPTSRQNSQPQQRRHYPGGVGEEEPDSLLFTNAGCDSFRIHLPDGDLVNVNKRPNLDIFLSEITSKFETYIFTAAVEVRQILFDSVIVVTLLRYHGFSPHALLISLNSS